MPNKPPSDRMRAKGGPPSPEFCPGAPELTSGFSPNMQNEPNLIPANRQKPTANSYFYETNPIYPYPSLAHNPKMQNEPNFRPDPPSADPKMRNEPNPRPFRVCYAGRRSVSMHIGKPNLPHSHPAPRKKHETNPIYANPSLAHDPNMRNEPNLPSSRPKNTKRTQFIAPRVSCRPGAPTKNAKRTQFSYTKCPTTPLFLRNEPNFTRPTTKKRETNPISAPRHLFYFLLSTFSSLAGNSPRPAAISLCAARSYGGKKGGAGKSLYNNNLGKFKVSS